MTTATWTLEQVEHYLEILEAFYRLAHLGLVTVAVLWGLEVVITVLERPRRRTFRIPTTLAPRGLGDPHGIRHHPNRD